MLENLEKMGLAWVRLIKAHAKLFLLEAKLAKASIVPIVLSGFTSFILLMSTWGLILLLGVVGIHAITHSLFLSVLIVLVINILILVSLGVFVSKLFKQLTFHNTRAHFKQYGGQLTHGRRDIKKTD